MIKGIQKDTTSVLEQSYEKDMDKQMEAGLRERFLEIECNIGA